jgi:hypothetical protein
MTDTNHALNNFMDNDWQLLGQFKVSPGTDIESMIGKWLIETLEPLQLHSDIVDKILFSALQAARNATLPGRRGEFEHFHFVAFSQRHLPDQPTTWGFFRIEKIEAERPASLHPDHAIEFYLYPEGHMRVIHPDQGG